LVEASPVILEVCLSIQKLVEMLLRLVLFLPELLSE